MDLLGIVIFDALHAWLLKLESHATSMLMIPKSTDEVILAILK